jgi:hypothetical protein
MCEYYCEKCSRYVEGAGDGCPNCGDGYIDGNELQAALGEYEMTPLDDGTLRVEVIVDGEIKWSRLVPRPQTSGPGRLDLRAFVKARRDAASWARRNGVELV